MSNKHHNQQELRRRPLSVNDVYGRRCQEVKISNTTTITTCSSSQDAANITTTTYRNVDGRNNATTYTTVNKKQESSRSRSAYATTSTTEHPQSSQYHTTTNYYPCHPNISTNTSITLPIKRKIKFVYGDDPQDNKQNLDPSSKQQSSVKGNDLVEVKKMSGGDSIDDLPSFPYVKHSVQTKLPCSTITNCVEINNQGAASRRCIEEEYDNFDEAYSSNVNRGGDLDIGNMRIKVIF